MKNLNCATARVLALILLAMGLTNQVQGQEKFLIKNQQVTTTAINSTQAQLIGKNAPSFENKQYWILKSDAPMTKEKMRACATAGIVFGQYLEHNLY